MVHETYKLINAIKKMYPVVEFLHNRFSRVVKYIILKRRLLKQRKMAGKLRRLLCLLLAGL